MPQWSWSISTCTGASGSWVYYLPPGEVYLRVYGGIQTTNLDQFETYGLSPRVRGHLFFLLLQGVAHGSIPACAGASTAGPCQDSAGGVYPRVCGGIIMVRCRCGVRGGLSPRVRGHPS